MHQSPYVVTSCYGRMLTDEFVPCLPRGLYMHSIDIVTCGGKVHNLLTL